MKNTVADKLKQVPEEYLVVGIDPHKRRHAAVAITRNFATRDKFKFDNSQNGMERLLNRTHEQMVKSEFLDLLQFSEDT
jgi:hypothetical protein